MIYFHPRMPLRDIARFCILEGYDVRAETRYRPDGSRLIVTLAVPAAPADMGDFIDHVWEPCAALDDPGY
jgi:hypothetical protein